MGYRPHHHSQYIKEHFQPDGYMSCGKGFCGHVGNYGIIKD